MEGEDGGDDVQVKLQRESGGLIKEFEQSLFRFLWKSAGMFDYINILPPLPIHASTYTPSNIQWLLKRTYATGVVRRVVRVSKAKQLIKLVGLPQTSLQYSKWDTFQVALQKKPVSMEMDLIC